MLELRIQELENEIERLRQRFRIRYFRQHPERIDDERIKIEPCYCEDETCYGWQIVIGDE